MKVAMAPMAQGNSAWTLKPSVRCKARQLKPPRQRNVEAVRERRRELEVEDVRGRMWLRRRLWLEGLLHYHPWPNHLDRASARGVVHARTLKLTRLLRTSKGGLFHHYPRRNHLNRAGFRGVVHARAPKRTSKWGLFHHYPRRNQLKRAGFRGVIHARAPKMATLLRPRRPVLGPIEA